MGNYLKQISATNGLLSEDRFREMYDAIRRVASDPKWDSTGTVKEMRKSYDFRDLCYIMGIRLVPQNNGLFTVDVNGAYDSSFWIPLLKASAPYVNDGEVVVRGGSSSHVTAAVFRNGSVEVVDRVDIEPLWTAACSNDKDTIEYHFEASEERNLRYRAFGQEHSLILGAFRNGHMDMCELLISYGETVTDAEREELLEPEKRRKLIEMLGMA